MISLDQWRTEYLCPSCGWPRDVCQDPYVEWNYEVDSTRCQISTLIGAAQERYGTQPGARPHGLLWGVKPKNL